MCVLGLCIVYLNFTLNAAGKRPSDDDGYDGDGDLMNFALGALVAIAVFLQSTLRLREFLFWSHKCS